MKRRKKPSTPLLLFWSKRDQSRFIETVERLCSLVNDLETVLAPRKRKAAAKAAVDAARNLTAELQEEDKRNGI